MLKTIVSRETSSTRRRAGWRLYALAGIVALATTAAGLWAVPGTQALPAGCTLAPTLLETSINQGLPTYGNLVPRKSTLVRLFLAKPACADTNDKIELTSATINVNINGVGKTYTPVTAITSPYPQLSDNSLGPIADSTANPIFVIPGADLTVPSVGTYNISVTASVKYIATPAGGVAGSQLTKALPETGTPPTTATVGAKTNDLRVLVVPMGDPKVAYATNWPATATEALGTGMSNLRRALPVRDGAVELKSATAVGGVRYTVSPNVLDVTATGVNAQTAGPNGTKFCGTSANFRAIADRLSLMRSAYNSANPTAQADLVMGAVWEANSYGVLSSGVTCDEGRAEVPGVNDWVRVTSEKTGGQMTSGSAMIMEVTHNLGAVPTDGTDSRATIGYHSKNVAADVSKPDRAYNVLGRNWIADDRSGMQSSFPSWTTPNVLLEPEDFNRARCRLTPGATGCGTSGTIGQASASNDAGWIGLGGTVTKSGTSATADLHSFYFTGSATADAPAPTSEFTLQLLDGNGLPQTNGTFLLPTSPNADYHDDDPAPSSSVLDISFITRALPGTAGLRVVYGGKTIYQRTTADGTPEYTSTVYSPYSGEVNRTATPAVSEADPSVSTDGKVAAWEAPTGVVVGLSAKTGSTVSVNGALDPALVDDGAGHYRLAYATANGDIYVANVSATANGVTVGTATIAYIASLQPLPLPAASSPAWSPAPDENLAVQIAGDTWVIDSSFPPTTPILCSPANVSGSTCYKFATQATSPAWSYDGRIAFVRNGGIVVKPVSPADAAEQAGPNPGTAPSWGTDVLAFQSGSNVAIVRRTSLLGTPQVIAAGATPAISAAAADGSSTIALGRGSPTSDIFIGKLGSPGDISFTVKAKTIPRADIFLEESSSTHPVVIGGLKPVAWTPPTLTNPNGTAVFSTPFHPGPGCGGCNIVARVSSGYLTNTKVVGQIPPDNEPTADQVEITTPWDGLVKTQFESLPLDAHSGDNSGTFAWFITAPAGTRTQIATGANPGEIQAPATTGWAPGTYLVEVDYHGPQGDTTAFSHVTFKKDSDGDGWPDDPEPSCIGGNGDLDGSNAHRDADGDGVDNWAEHEKSPGSECVSAENATTDFDPNTLYIPSSGQTVTAYIRSTTGCDLRTVTDARISSMGGYPENLPAMSWQVDTSGLATVKFDKQKLNADLQSVQPQGALIGRYVRLTITGTACQLYTFDHTAPITSPT